MCKNPTPLLAYVQNATRGDNMLYVSNTTNLYPGLWVRLLQDNPPTGGLVANLMGGYVTEDANFKGKADLLSFNTRVTFVSSNFIKVDRTLPYNVSTQWNPQLHLFSGE